MMDDRCSSVQVCFEATRKFECIASICKGDREVARAVTIRALRELADELEGEEGGAVIEWDPVLKIPVMKNRK